MSDVDVDGIEDEQRPSLAPPPRRVSLRVLWEFLAYSRPAFSGCLFLGLTGVQAVPPHPRGQVLFAVVLGTLALGCLAAALLEARRRMRLLATGLPALGRITLVLARQADGSNCVIPFSESSPEPGTRPMVAPLRWGGCAWIALAVLVSILGLTACGLMLHQELTEPASLRLFGRPLSRWAGTLFIVACTAAILLLGIRMIVQGGQWLSTRPLDPPSLRLLMAPRRALKCSVRFAPPGDGTVQSDRFDATFVREGPVPPEQRILYDPRNPKSVLLIDGHFPPIAYSEAGTWDSVWPGRSGWRLAGMALLALGGAPLAFLGWMTAP
jgi:hypothetical protein